MRRRGVVVSIVASLSAALAGAGALSLSLAPEACSIHNCDFSFPQYGMDYIQGIDASYFTPPLGDRIDENTWESSPIDADWMDFPGQRIWVLHMPGFLDRTIETTTAYLSVDQHPTAEGSNWAIASGNLAEFSNPHPEPFDAAPGLANYVIFVKNDTCAHYFLRVVITFVPLPPRAPVDAGIDAPDDGATDARNDAMLDAGSD